MTWHGGSLAKTSSFDQGPIQAPFRHLLPTLAHAADNPEMNQREIAEKLGVSTICPNYCFHALIDKGWVKVQNFNKSKNNFGYIYLLTPESIAEKALFASHFLKRKMTDYEQFQAEIEALKADTGSMDVDGQKVQNE